MSLLQAALLSVTFCLFTSSSHSYKSPQKHGPLSPTRGHPVHSRNRRTFITALLAAEVTYLEALLKRPQFRKQRKHTIPKRHKPYHNKSYNRITYSANYKFPVNHPTSTTIAEVKIDPFYALDAPDLSNKSCIQKQPLKNKETALYEPALKESPVFQLRIKEPASNIHTQKFSNHKKENLTVHNPRKQEVAEYNPTTEKPKGSYPTYGAYRAYKIPQFASTTSVPVTFVKGKFVDTSFHDPTTNSPIQTSSSTLKYGDFELYLPSSDSSSIGQKDWPHIYYNTIVRGRGESSKKENNFQ